jgi:hypothetical protein
VGPTGARGPAGRDANVTCKVAHVKTSKSKKKKTTVQVKCTVRFSTAKIVARASLSRRGVVYARGTTSKGKLHMKSVRKMRAGSYRLKIVTRDGKTIGSVVQIALG